MEELARLTVQMEDVLSADMEALRRRGWGNPSIASAGDDFDADSVHLVVRLAGRPVGMVRVTRGPRSPLLAWSGGRAPLPVDPSVAELTRGVVAPEMRRLGIYRLAMLETVLRLDDLGFSTATGAVEPGFPARPFLEAMGFVAVGAPVLFDDTPRRQTLAQCLRLDVSRDGQPAWRDLRQSQLDELRSAGYLVDSDLAAHTVDEATASRREAWSRRGVTPARSPATRPRARVAPILLTPTQPRRTHELSEQGPEPGAPQTPRL